MIIPFIICLITRISLFVRLYETGNYAVVVLFANEIILSIKPTIDWKIFSQSMNSYSISVYAIRLY